MGITKPVFKISEDDLQANCVKWFRAQYSQFYWRMFAIPNAARRSPGLAAIMKRTGLISGVWDLFISIPCKGVCGMYIELKVGKNELTKNQEEFRAANIWNYRFKVCRSLEEFIKEVDKYLK